MPGRVCEVTGDNDPQQRWLTVEAMSTCHAAIVYWDMVAALMGPDGVPAPTPETIFQVRVDDGRVVRVRAKRALEWVDQVAERLIRGARR
jgi:hypothetical protein